MRCDFPKSAKLTDAVKDQWDAAFEFVHTCSTYDHNYMAIVLCDAIHGKTRLQHPAPVKIVVSYFINYHRFGKVNLKLCPFFQIYN